MKPFAALLLVLALATGSNAYEFTLLNGMKLNGALKSFNDGRFYVDTGFGQVVIEADKLDYIIVEEGDPGPCASKDVVAPGLGLGEGMAEAEKVVLAQSGEPAAPQPLSSRSVTPPAPLRDRSVRDEGPGTFGADPSRAYPGLFRGGQ